MSDNKEEKDSKEIEQEEWFINRNKIFKNENLFLNLKKLERNRPKKPKPKLKVLNINVSEF